MLEATDYESGDLFSPIFGEIVDTLCGKSGTAPVTEVFCSYADLVHSIRQHFSSPGWTEHELSLLDALGNRFRNVSTNFSSLYQAPNMAL